MLDDAARRDIADQFARWRAGITLPIPEAELLDKIGPLLARILTQYGPQGLEELGSALDAAQEPCPATNPAEPVGPEPEPGTPAYMGRVLMEVEQYVHLGGWDQNPVLIAVCGTGDLAPDWQQEALMTGPAYWGDWPPVEVLARYAAFLNDQIQYKPGAPAETVAGVADARNFILDGLADPQSPLRALVLIAETYVYLGTPEDRDRYPGDIGDHPDANEARTLIAVSPDGIVWMVERIRGQDPGGWWRRPATREGGLFGAETSFARADFSVIQGRVVRSMQRIVNAVNTRAGRPLLDLASPDPVNAGSPPD